MSESKLMKLHVSIMVGVLQELRETSEPTARMMSIITSVRHVVILCA